MRRIKIKSGSIIILCCLSLLSCKGFSTDELADGAFLDEPEIKNVLVQSSKLLQVNFDQPMSSAGLDVATNYEIKNDADEVLAITGISIVQGSDNKIIFINTDPQGALVSYRLTVFNLKSSLGKSVLATGASFRFRSLDIDIPGVTVTPTSGLATTENGGTANFNVFLTTQPTANVDISLNSSDSSEGTIAQSTLTFTTSNWSVPQTVTVTGQADCTVDGDQAYQIVLGTATSTDIDYNNLDPADVSLTNPDSPAAGVRITQSPPLQSTEAGGQASYSLQLDCQPTNDVTLTLSSTDTTEGQINQAGGTCNSIESPGTSSCQMVFTNGNYNSPQTVAITGTSDDIDDGNIAYQVTTTASSADSTFNGISVTAVDITNNDDGDLAGITVSAISSNPAEGDTATFTIRLDSEPIDDVSVTFSSSDLSEGRIKQTAGVCNNSGTATTADCTVTFTSANWNSTQTIGLVAQDDDIDDGNISYSINSTVASSTDGNYNGMTVADVAVITNDNDTAGVTVTPSTQITTTDGLREGNFQVSLNSEPTADVTITLMSNDISEGIITTPGSKTLTFTSANWSTAQNLVVTGQAADGDEPANYKIVKNGIISSSDANYNNIASVFDAGLDLTNIVGKRIFVTASTYNGDLGEKSGADAKCMSDSNKPSTGTYKAMIVYNATSFRRACTSGNCTNPSQNNDWVLEPNTTYIRPNGTVIQTTNAAGIFSFPLTNKITSGLNRVWTGLEPNWTTHSSQTCGDFSVGSTVSGTIGESDNTSSDAISLGSYNCAFSAKIYCVEQ